MSNIVKVNNMSEENLTGAQIKPHKMQCWYCKRFAQREIKEVNSKDGPDKFQPTRGTVIGEPVCTDWNGRRHYRYKVWTGFYKMNFGHFCMQKCATSWANKQVLGIRGMIQKKKDKNSLPDKQAQLIEMKENMGKVRPEHLESLQRKFNDNRH